MREWSKVYWAPILKYLFCKKKRSLLNVGLYFEVEDKNPRSQKGSNPEIQGQTNLIPGEGRPGICS